MGYLDGVLEDGPYHDLIASWGGEGAFVPEEIGNVSWQEAVKGEGCDVNFCICGSCSGVSE